MDKRYKLGTGKYKSRKALVSRVRKLRDRGLYVREIAVLTGTSFSSVSRILTDKYHNDVDDYTETSVFYRKEESVTTFRSSTPWLV